MKENTYPKKRNVKSESEGKVDYKRRLILINILIKFDC